MTYFQSSLFPTAELNAGSLSTVLHQGLTFATRRGAFQALARQLPLKQ